MFHPVIDTRTENYSIMITRDSRKMNHLRSSFQGSE